MELPSFTQPDQLLGIITNYSQTRPIGLPAECFLSIEDEFPELEYARRANAREVIQTALTVNTLFPQNANSISLASAWALVNSNLPIYSSLKDAYLVAHDVGYQPELSEYIYLTHVDAVNQSLMTRNTIPEYMLPYTQINERSWELNQKGLGKIADFELFDPILYTVVLKQSFQGAINVLNPDKNLEIRLDVELGQNWNPVIARTVATLDHYDHSQSRQIRSRLEQQVTELLRSYNIGKVYRGLGFALMARVFAESNRA